MTSQHHYEAFISYSHADRIAAVRLHRALERLRIPAHVATAAGLARRRFRPLFRDEDELTSSTDLPETLRAALQDSANLIVVCSPAAAASPWVDQEVRAFAELGDPQRIFCVLVAGDPDEPEQCFPPSLLSGGIPLAVNLRPDGEKHGIAVLRIAAGLLNVGFDDLRQRAKRDQKRRLLLQLSGAAAALALVSTVAVRIAVAPPCTNAAEQLASIWNPQVRNTITRQFTNTALPYADTMLSGVLKRLQNYHDQWSALHNESCAATMVRNEQSPKLMDLRMACLNERRTEFSSMIDLLEHADAEQVENAVTTTDQLGNLSRCSDTEQLQAAYPLPEDPAQRKLINQLRQDVANANAATSAGRLNSASTLLTGLVAASEEIDYPALTARAMLADANLLIASGDHDAAGEIIYEAAAKAVLARDTELVAEAWLILPDVLSDSKDELDQASQMLTLAGSYISQLPAGHPLEARFHAARGDVRINQGELEDGVLDLRAAVSIGRELDLAELGPLLTRLADGVSELYQLSEAQSLSEQAMTITLRDFGAHHPQHARALTVAADIQSALGNRETALTLMQQTVTIEEAAFAGSSPRLAHSLQRLGRAYSQTGQYQQAIHTFERVIAMEQTFPSPDWGNIAAAYNDMGDTYISIGDYDSARQSLESSLQVWVEQERIINIGIALGNLGNTSNRVGRFDEAVDYCQQALTNDEQYLQPDHPHLAYPLSCLGEALIGQGEPTAALQPLERAHSLRDQLDIDTASLAWTRWLYGRALVESGRNRDLGLRYVNFALDTFAEMPDVAASELADVEKWLASNAP